MSGPATRVTAGVSRGRVLKTPPGRATRPTTSLVREALFNIIGDSIRGARVLDLFPGAAPPALKAYSLAAPRPPFVDLNETGATISAGNWPATASPPKCAVA